MTILAVVKPIRSVTNSIYRSRWNLVNTKFVDFIPNFIKLTSEFRKICCFLQKLKNFRAYNSHLIWKTLHQIQKLSKNFTQNGIIQCGYKQFQMNKWKFSDELICYTIFHHIVFNVILYKFFMMITIYDGMI